MALEGKQVKATTFEPSKPEQLDDTRSCALLGDDLRSGVASAIKSLGRGFLAQPKNRRLREMLQTNELSKTDFYHEILRVVYRLLFLLVAEDRDLLFGREASETNKTIYKKYYSVSRLRELARKRRDSRHVDLWCSLRLLFGWLDRGRPEMDLPGIGSVLFREDFISTLIRFELNNDDLLTAIRHLTFMEMDNVLQAIDYRNMGTEELGSVYESLLEMHPDVDASVLSFELNAAAGNDRKTTGSYYTPVSLINGLLDTALEPVIQRAMDSAKTEPDREQALLDLKICDPACGTGHFLIGAAHRLARRLAAVRSYEDEPSAVEVRHALRDVVGRCLYGVDINPMAVELCKISLWMDAREPGRSLAFWDHHIQCGNALLGATPALLKAGIPDAAFETIEGDDKSYASKFKAENKKYRNRGEELHHDNLLNDQLRFYSDAWCAAFVWKKCKPENGGFDFPITESVFRKIEKNPSDCPPWMRDEINRLARQYQFFHWYLAFPDVFEVAVEVDEDTPQGWRGGFDVVLGNPPWERVKLQEKEWFAERDSAIANAPNTAARKTLIKNLKKNDPSLFQAFREAQRESEGASQFIRLSGRYPLCGRGDVNTYTIFAELNRQLLSPIGRVGCIVPSGIATEDTTKFFFQDLMEKRTLVSLYDFENRKRIFPAVDSRMKFCLLTLCSPKSPVEDGAELAFFALDTKDLEEDDKTFHLTPEEIAMINPNTRTCPIFRSVKDAELTKAIYRRVPVLIRESHQQSAGDEAGPPSPSPGNPWGISFSRLFDMSTDSHLFKTKEELEQLGFKMEEGRFVRAEERFLPLYEGKMVTSFDHRAADVVRSDTATHRQAQPRKISLAEHEIPSRLVIPMNWINLSDVHNSIPSTWKAPYLLGFSSVTSPTNERTFVPSLLPLSGVGNSFPIIFTLNSGTPVVALYGQLSSYVFDFVARQKVGGMNLNFYLVKQFPVLEPSTYKHISTFLPCSLLPYTHFLLPRIRELTYTSTDLRAFERDCGFDGEPFRWNEDRRFLLRCELDAVYFGLYLGFGNWSEATEHKETPEQRAELTKHFPTPRDAIDYIMDTFPIVKRKDEAAVHAGKRGRYRTKETILSIYDDMVAAIRTGTDYQTRLDPPPGHDLARHIS